MGGSSPCSLLLTLVKDIILLFIILIPVLFAALLTFIIYLWRAVVIIVAKTTQRARLGEILGPAELYFVATDPGIFSTPQRCLSICVTVKGRIDPSSLKQNIVSKVTNLRNPNGSLMYDRLQQHVAYWLGYAFFEWDTDFSIDKHVRVTPNSNLGGASEEERIASLITLQENETFERKASIWNVTLVPGFMSEDRTLVYLKFHHTLGDGLSIIKLLLNKMSGTRLDPVPVPSVGANRGTTLGNLTDWYRTTIGLPRILYQERRSQADLLPRPRALNPKLFISTTKGVPLELFKELKRSINVSFTNAINACLSFALSKYVEKHEAGDADLEYLTGTCVSPLPGHPDNRLTNYYGLVNVNIPLSLGSWNTEKALLQCREEIKMASTLKSPLAYNLIGRGISYFPSKWSAAFFRNMVAPALFTSNMPGPPRSVFLFGQEIETMIFYVRHQHAPWLNVSIMSYNGIVRIGLLASSQIIKSHEILEELRGDFETALHQLLRTSTV